VYDCLQFAIQTTNLCTLLLQCGALSDDGRKVSWPAHDHHFTQLPTDLFRWFGDPQVGGPLKLPRLAGGGFSLQLQLGTSDRSSGLSDCLLFIIIMRSWPGLVLAACVGGICQQSGMALPTHKLAAVTSAPPRQQPATTTTPDDQLPTNPSTTTSHPSHSSSACGTRLPPWVSHTYHVVAG